MLIFGIYREADGKRVKKISAVTMDTIFKNFFKYALDRGFEEPVFHTASFGNTAYKNKNNDILILRPENI